jgi:hypothetical protein
MDKEERDSFSPQTSNVSVVGFVENRRRSARFDGIGRQKEENEMIGFQRLDSGRARDEFRILSSIDDGKHPSDFDVYSSPFFTPHKVGTQVSGMSASESSSFTKGEEFSAMSPVQLLETTNENLNYVLGEVLMKVNFGKSVRDGAGATSCLPPLGPAQVRQNKNNARLAGAGATVSQDQPPPGLSQTSTSLTTGLQTTSGPVGAKGTSLTTGLQTTSGPVGAKGTLIHQALSGSARTSAAPTPHKTSKPRLAGAGATVGLPPPGLSQSKAGLAGAGAAVILPPPGLSQSGSSLMTGLQTESGPVGANATPIHQPVFGSARRSATPTPHKASKPRLAGAGATVMLPPPGLSQSGCSLMTGLQTASGPVGANATPIHQALSGSAPTSAAPTPFFETTPQGVAPTQLSGSAPLCAAPTNVFGYETYGGAPSAPYVQQGVLKQSIVSNDVRVNKLDDPEARIASAEEYVKRQMVSQKAAPFALGLVPRAFGGPQPPSRS